MPKIVLLDAETRGVDLRTNPLFIGKKKLHSAVNLIFEEGVVRSRFGFSYNFLGCTGRFQGFAEYYPKKGLSTETFSLVEGNLVVAVSGAFYMGCQRVACVTFPATGNINLYQAENWLILQHRDFSTYWWDGTPLTCAVRSPGVSVQDWDDSFGVGPPTIPPDPPIPTPPPLPEPPPPVPTPDQDSEIRVVVVDDNTEEVVIGAAITLTVNDSTAYSGITDDSGAYVKVVPKRSYELTVSKDLYETRSDIPVDGLTDQIVIVRLKYGLVPFNVLGFLSNPATIEGVYPDDVTTYGLTDVAAAFGVPLDGVPPGNAYRTRWRLVTDACGFDVDYFNFINIEYGLMDDDGSMLLGDWDGVFVSQYLHPEGIYIQLGVIVDEEVTWSARTPCIAGGATSEDYDADGTPNELDADPNDPRVQ